MERYLRSVMIVLSCCPGACARSAIEMAADASYGEAGDAGLGEAGNAGDAGVDHTTEDAADASRDERDANVANDGAGEAGVEPDAALANDGAAGDARPPEGGCTDSDDDGQCDETDNCPGIPNVDQADADGDGIGDLCDATPGTCVPDTITAGATSGGVAFASIGLGGAGNVASPGAPITLTIDYHVTECSLFDRPRHVRLGFEGQPSRCFEIRSLDCRDNDPARLQISINAPSAGGLYYLTATGSQDRFCSGGALTGAPRIAAVCVE